MTKTPYNKIKIPSLWYKENNYKKKNNLENIHIGYKMLTWKIK